MLVKVVWPFLQLIFNVHAYNRGFWQFRFHGDHFNHDSQNSFSVHYDSKTPKIVDHGVKKISLGGGGGGGGGGGATK